MGQFINSDCNTWKASRPSPHCYFMAAHKSRPSSTTVAATTAIKINTAVTNAVVAALMLFVERGAFRTQSSKSNCEDELSVVNRQHKSFLYSEQ